MAYTRKKDHTKAKLCREKVEVLEFDPEEREKYLVAQSKRRKTRKKQQILLMEEQKKEARREKRKNQKAKESKRAEIAQRVIETAMGKEEETEERIGNSIVTIREL